MPFFYGHLAVGDAFDHGSDTATAAKILEFAEGCDDFLSGAVALGARGVDELRWRRPVFSATKMTTSNEDERVFPVIGLVKVAQRTSE